MAKTGLVLKCDPTKMFSENWEELLNDHGVNSLDNKIRPQIFSIQRETIYTNINKISKKYTKILILTV